MAFNGNETNNGGDVELVLINVNINQLNDNNNREIEENDNNRNTIDEVDDTDNEMRIDINNMRAFNDDDDDDNSKDNYDMDDVDEEEEENDGNESNPDDDDEDEQIAETRQLVSNHQLNDQEDCDYYSDGDGDDDEREEILKCNGGDGIIANLFTGLYKFTIFLKSQFFFLLFVFVC